MSAIEKQLDRWWEAYRLCTPVQICQNDRFMGSEQKFISKKQNLCRKSVLVVNRYSEHSLLSYMVNFWI